MPLAVVADADILFGGTTRALFMYLDYAGLLHVHWSQRILTELSTALVSNGRKPNMDSARANERLMNISVRNALVEQALVDRHEAAMRAYVHDPDDAHVAACAYELATGGYYPSGSIVVVSTRNLSDYKSDRLSALGIVISHLDEFLMSLGPAGVAPAFRACRLDLASQPAVEQLLLRLVRDGNPMIARALRAGAESGEFEL